MPQSETSNSDDDFPYCRGQPTAIKGGGWLLALAMVVPGFMALTTLGLRWRPTHQ